MIETYRPSGLFSPLAFLLAAIGAVAMVALGWVYQLSLHWIPLIYLNALAVVGFGMAGGWVAGAIVRAGRVRSPMLAIAIACVAMAPGVAASHYFAFQRWFDDGVNELATQHGLSPDEMRELITDVGFWDYVENRLEYGWTIGKVGTSNQSKPSISGPFVYGVWAIEALLALAFAIAMARTAARKPFCELTQRWADQPTVLLVRHDVPAQAIEQLGQAVRTEDLVRLPPAEPAVALPEGASAPPVAVHWSIDRPRGDDGTPFLSITRHWIALDKQGKAQPQQAAIWQHVPLEPAQLQAIEAACAAFSASKATPA